MILDTRKALAYELHDLCARLRIGSCPSHHSSNEVIPLSMTSNVHGQETTTIYSSTSLLTRGLLGTCCGLCIHTCITVSVRTPILSHIDLACNTSYPFAASRTVFPRVPAYRAQDRLCLLDSVASIHMTKNPGRHD